MIYTQFGNGSLLLTMLILITFAMGNGVAEELKSKNDPERVLPKWELKNSGVTTSIRGICAVDGKVCWFGTKGGVSRTIDGGQTWRFTEIGDEELDFRDVEAFDAQRCIAMSAGTGTLSRLYLTENGGTTWKIVHHNAHDKGFFNGIVFRDEKHGVLAGDPIGGRLFLLSTDDGGMSWQRLAKEGAPKMQEGEHAFAASGTHLAVDDHHRIWVTSGGEVTRVFRSSDWGKTWNTVQTPMLSGEPSTGIFSIAFHGDNGFAVGGDYQKEFEGQDNAMLTVDGGRSWRKVTEKGAAPFHFRSCVAYLNAKSLVTVGPSGSDISYDGGHQWRSLAEQKGFHTLSLADGVAWAAGAEGRIARMRIQDKK